MVGMKKCTKCKIEKPLKDFYKNYQTKNSKSSWCKECFGVLIRDNYLKRTHGITSVEYEEMLVLQNYGCAICGKKEDTFLPQHNKNKMLAVDHCHETGKIRGLLCENCNRAIGLLKDDIQLLENSITYLDQF